MIEKTMANTHSEKAIEIINVTKTFGTFTALDNVDFDINDNEFFTLLGPSGCGKTTLLRMIAGFETPNSGQIKLHGEDIKTLPAHKRRVNTVFQNYALFPHMNLEQNIAYGLTNLGWPKDKIKDRVAKMLDMVHMSEFAKRRPAQLSGGQKQRIALARALAPEPEVLLLDEPLSALDLKLRQNMRNELRELQKKAGITFVFVTHDQEEALDMSDRICVLGDGKIQQLGTPNGIYENPENSFVANFIGETNFFDVDVLSVKDDFARVKTSFGLELNARQKNATAGQKAKLSLRPEKITFSKAKKGIVLDGEIASKNYLGGTTQYVVTVKDADFKISQSNTEPNRSELQPGERATISFLEESAWVLGH